MLNVCSLHSAYLCGLCVNQKSFRAEAAEVAKKEGRKFAYNRQHWTFLSERMRPNIRRITPLQCRISPATLLIDIGNRPWLTGLDQQPIALLRPPHRETLYPTKRIK